MSKAVGSPLSFCLGVGNVVLSTYLVGALPSFYFIWHMVKNVTLMIHRNYTYKSKKWDYMVRNGIIW